MIWREGTYIRNTATNRFFAKTSDLMWARNETKHQYFFYKLDMQWLFICMIIDKHVSTTFLRREHMTWKVGTYRTWNTGWYGLERARYSSAMGISFNGMLSCIKIKTKAIFNHFQVNLIHAIPLAKSRHLETHADVPCGVDLYFPLESHSHFDVWRF